MAGGNQVIFVIMTVVTLAIGLFVGNIALEAVNDSYAVNFSGAFTPANNFIGFDVTDETGNGASGTGNISTAGIFGILGLAAVAGTVIFLARRFLR